MPVFIMQKHLLTFAVSLTLLAGCATSTQPISSSPPRVDTAAILTQSTFTAQTSSDPIVQPAVVETFESVPVVPPQQKKPSVAQPKPPAKQRDSSLSDSTPLAAGKFVWQPELSPTGALALFIALNEQQAYVYRNGILIGRSSISSGRPGYETPVGAFTILQKKRHHVSNLYEGAKMPYMQRLTWDGIALHAGDLPGRPASHGCIRLPPQFAKLLYKSTRLGTQVIVTDTLAEYGDLGYL